MEIFLNDKCGYDDDDDDDDDVYRWPAIVEQDPNTKKYLEFHTESDLTPVCLPCHTHLSTMLI